MRKIVTGFLIGCVLLSMSVGAYAVKKRTAEDVLYDMVLQYGYYEEAGEPKVIGYMKELKAMDPEKAELWQQIMDYWRYCDKLEPNLWRLPDDLPQTEELCLAALGFELNPDGTMQEELISRLETLLYCAQQYPNAYVLCTGGGTAANAPKITEADAMASWLVSHGLDAKRLIVENRSMTTGQNAKRSHAILKEKYPQIQQVAIITSNYHIGWGSLMFQSEFLLTGSTVRVVSNAACDVSNEKYNDNHMYEAAGLMELANLNTFAGKLYRKRYQIPGL